MPTKEGHFRPDNPKALKAWLSFKGNKKKPSLMRAVFEDWHPDQSDAQRKKWFISAVKPFCEKMGYRFNNALEKELVHHEIMVALGRYEIKTVLGKEVKVPHSMARGKMTTEQFQELYEDVQRLGAEWDVVILDLSASEIEAMKAASSPA